MKIKFLAVLGLATFVGLAGCRSATNTNVMTTNANMMNTNMAMTTPMAAADTTTQTAVKSALDKAGFTDVTVSATTAEVTLRGSVAKDKLAEAIRIAQETGRKPVKNEMSVK